MKEFFVLHLKLGSCSVLLSGFMVFLKLLLIEFSVSKVIINHIITVGVFALGPGSFILMAINKITYEIKRGVFKIDAPLIAVLVFYLIPSSVIIALYQLDLSEHYLDKANYTEL